MADFADELVVSHEIMGGLRVGDKIRVQGFVPGHGSDFSLNLDMDENMANVGLHLRPYIQVGCSILNSRISNVWGSDRRVDAMPLRTNAEFNIVIECGATNFRILVNGSHYTDFEYRLPVQEMRYIFFKRHVRVDRVEKITAGGEVIQI